MTGYLLGVATGIVLVAILEVLVMWHGGFQGHLRRPEPAPEFKSAKDQDPIDPPRKPGETRISRVNYSRQTETRRLVRGSKPKDQK